MSEYFFYIPAGKIHRQNNIESPSLYIFSARFSEPSIKTTHAYPDILVIIQSLTNRVLHFNIIKIEYFCIGLFSLL